MKVRNFIASPFIFIGGILLFLSTLIMLIGGWIMTGNHIKGSVFIWGIIYESVKTRLEVSTQELEEIGKER